MSERIFHLTPPLRRAIAELASACIEFAQYGGDVPKKARRLREAQQIIGLEIFLDSFINEIELIHQQKDAA